MSVATVEVILRLKSIWSTIRSVGLVAVKENQQVKAGDLLFRIDPEPFQLQIAQADAAIAKIEGLTAVKGQVKRLRLEELNG